MDDSVSRFRDKYITKTIIYNVPERTRQWYVRHIEDYIKARNGERLAAASMSYLETYLEGIGRKRNIVDWKFRRWLMHFVF